MEYHQWVMEVRKNQFQTMFMLPSLAQTLVKCLFCDKGVLEKAKEHDQIALEIIWFKSCYCCDASDLKKAKVCHQRALEIGRK